MAGRTSRDSTDKVSVLQRGGGDYPDFPEYMDLPSDPDLAESVGDLYRWVLRTRAASDWGPDATLAAEYAQTCVRLADYQRQLDRDGPTIDALGSKGQVVQKRHPCLDAITSLGNRQIALARTLGLTGLPSSKASVKNQASKLGGTFKEQAPTAKGPAPDWAKLARELDK